MKEIFRKLEFDKVLTRLADCAQSEIAKRILFDPCPDSHGGETDPTSQLVKEIHLRHSLSFDEGRAEKLLNLTVEGASLLRKGNRSPDLSSLSDPYPILSKLGIGALLEIKEMGAVRSLLNLSSEVKEWGKGIPSGLSSLSELTSRVDPLSEIRKEMKRTFNEELEILDKASERLHDIRTDLWDLEGRIRNEIDRAMGHKGRDALLTVRNNRFAASIQREEWRGRGMVVDISSGGHLLYIEPEEIVPLNNRRTELIFREEEEVRRILAKLSDLIRTHSLEIEMNFKAILELDIILAKATYSERIAGTKPSFSKDKILSLVKVGHPLIQERFVPHTLSLKPPLCTGMISGVNAGGKTVLLKLIGISYLLAYAGVFVPAQEAELVPISHLFVDIGDDQSIMSDLSAYTAHLSFVKELSRRSPEFRETNPALVLIDEIGRGTEPGEGGALALAVIEWLLEENILLFVTTHYEVLKGLALINPRVKNFSLGFDEERLRPTFNLVEDLPGRSFGLLIAKSFGIPDEVIQRSREFLTGKEGELSEIIEAVQSEYAVLSEKRESLDQILAKSESDSEALVKERDKLKRLLLELRGEMETRLQKFMEEARQELKENIQAMSRQVRATEMKGLTRAASTKVEGEFDRSLEEILRELRLGHLLQERVQEDIEIGEEVLLTESLTLGRIVTLDEKRKRAIVEVSGKKVESPLSRLIPRRLLKPEELERLKRRLSLRDKRQLGAALDAAHIERTESQGILDLHGFTAEEAREALEGYFGRVISFGIESVRINHGIGTGVLRRLTREFLSTLQIVSRIENAPTSEGGVGVTIVYLKSGQETNQPG